MSPIQAIRRSAALAVLAISLHPAFGHDTFETTVVGKPNEAGIEVRVTLSGFGANNLLRQSGMTVPGGMAASFEELRPRLAELAGKLIEVSVDDVALALTRGVVVPGEEGHVEFQLNYPRPEKRDIQMHVAYLAQLGQGFRAELTLFNEAGVGSILNLKERHQPFVAWSLDHGARIMDEAPADLGQPRAEAVAVASSPATAGDVGSNARRSDSSPPQVPVRTFPIILVVVLACIALTAFWFTRRKPAH